jgi:hypothetical protein
MGEAKLLGGRIDVVELERGQTAAVAASLTAASKLGYEHLLDLASAAYHGLLSTEAAAVVAARFEDVLAGSVLWALEWRST